MERQQRADIPVGPEDLHPEDPDASASRAADDPVDVGGGATDHQGATNVIWSLLSNPAVAPASDQSNNVSSVIVLQAPRGPY